MGWMTSAVSEPRAAGGRRTRRLGAGIPAAALAVFLMGAAGAATPAVQIPARDTGEWRGRLEEAERLLGQGQTRRALELLQRAIEFGTERLLPDDVLAEPAGGDDPVEDEPQDAPAAAARRPARFPPAPEPAAPARPRRSVFTPVAEHARQRLARLDPASLGVYRELYGAVAAAELERGVERSDPALVDRVAERYPQTPAGQRARLLRAQRRFTGGWLRRALVDFRSLRDDLDRVATGAADGAGAGAAAAAEHAALHIDASLGILACLDVLAAGVDLARERERFLSGAADRDAAARALRRLDAAALGGRQAETVARPISGEGAGGRLRTSLPSIAAAEGAFELEWVATAWARSEAIAPVELTYNPGNYPEAFRHNVFLPAFLEETGDAGVLDGPAILLSGVFYLWKLDLRGRLQARLAKPALPARAATFQERSDSPLYTAVVTPDTVYESSIQDLIVSRTYLQYFITMDVPTRCLVARDRRTGLPRWDTKRLFAGSPEDPRPISIVTPPLVRDGRVYAGGSYAAGFINSVVVALDDETGEPIWQRPVVSHQVELTMFGEPARETMAGFLAEEEGILYHVSQLGAVAAIEASSGAILWMSTYDTIPCLPTLEPVPNFRDIVWGPSAPLLIDGVLWAAPRDALFLYAIDTGLRTSDASRPGGLLARHYNSGGQMRDVLGLHRGRLYLSGTGGVQALDTSRVAGGGPLVRLSSAGVLGQGARPMGLAALTRQGIVFAGRSHLHLVDLDLGRVVQLTREPFIETHGFIPGNVTVAGDRILVTSRDVLSSYRVAEPVPAEGREF